MTTRLFLAALACATALPVLPALAQEAETAPESEAVDAQVESGESDTAASEASEEAASMSQGATGVLVTSEGTEIGNASVSLAASGNGLVVINAEGVPEGVHAVHLHMVGLCEGPDFESAGEHIAGTREHGVLADAGPHPGDLPNATVGADGVLTMDGVAVGLTMEMLLDADGSALIVHANADDYTSQPSGDAGGRIACAVMEPGGDVAQ